MKQHEYFLFQGNTSSCINLDNSTVTINTTGNKRLYESVYHVLYGYGLPTICICGFLGNVMNLVILAGKRVQHSLRTKERSANIGLITLAIADLSFCVTAFPSTFLPQDMTFSKTGFMLYYGQYCAAVISIFIMTSTWVTVTMSTERYLAICHPLKSRNIITLQRTKWALALVYVLSAVVNIPIFWRYKIHEFQACDRDTVYTIKQQILYGNIDFDHAYRATWAVVGNIIPLALLLILNVALLREIHKSYALRKTMNGVAGMKVHHMNDATKSSNRITILLIAIVVMFLILVAPSEILKHVAYPFGGNLSQNYTYMTIEIITNVMQTINFSANFILYCIINPSFRRTMKEMLCFQYQKVDNTEFCEHSGLDRGSSIRLVNKRINGRSSLRKASSPRVIANVCSTSNVSV